MCHCSKTELQVALVVTQMLVEKKQLFGLSVLSRYAFMRRVLWQKIVVAAWVIFRIILVYVCLISHDCQKVGDDNFYQVT